MVNKSFILSDYEEIESDIVYKINNDEEEIYFYILLELQSKVDYIEFVNRLKEIVLTFNKLSKNDKMKLRHWIKNVIDEEFKKKFEIDKIITAQKQEVESMTSNISRTLREEYEKAKREGLEKGKIEDAKNFLILGVDEEIVAKGTGLSLDKIKEIKEELNKK